MSLRYEPVEDGYRIVGSRERFNRALFGGHRRDDRSERFFTLAGDQPIVLGALTDWHARDDCSHSKCGVFMAGVALTPGLQIPIFQYHGAPGGDRTAQWFHDADGTVSTFRDGWMEHEVRPFFQSAPVVEARLQVLPLQSEDGFLVRLRVSTDQRVHLVIAFGGITGFVGSLEYPFLEARNLRPEDCRGNVITIGRNRATVRSSPGHPCPTEMRIGSTFPVNVAVTDARRVAQPGLFLAEPEGPIEAPLVRMSCPIGPGEILDGSVVVLRDAGEETLTTWIEKDDPAGEIEREILTKGSALAVRTPDHRLDLTVLPNVLALDSAWHGTTFFHGAYSWHCPFLGWRNWYGATVLGWHGRVKTAFATHAASQVRSPEGTERVSWDGSDASHEIVNSDGHLPEIPDGRTGFNYNMQEVGVDMILHSLEWTADFEYAERYFDVIRAVLAWEERILDPDGDGLYQNWLNTWISDAHSYNGGGCAQASAYNHRANLLMGRLAEKLGRDPRPFLSRARKIREACQRLLWQPGRGVMAEYIDTIGNRLVHPSPELATIYHAIECGTVDPFQACQMLRFTETVLRNERTMTRGGRLVWSSDWYPQNYSSCGLYPAENMHLAWAYFQTGQSAAGNEILKALVDGHFLGRYPGLLCHCATASGYTDGSPDFTDVSSMYLRLLVEGLFGIVFRLLEDRVDVAPQLPPEWEHASLASAAVSMGYRRTGRTESFTVAIPHGANVRLRVRLRAASVERVTVNGLAADCRLEPGIGFCSCVVEAQVAGETTFSVTHGEEQIPRLCGPGEAVAGRAIEITADGGTIEEVRDPSACLADVAWGKAAVRGVVRGTPGGHTVFVRVVRGQWDGWLPADFTISGSTPSPDRAGSRRTATVDPVEYTTVDLSRQFNESLAEIHRREYWEPRPRGFSRMTRLNGRFDCEWNQGGYNAVVVDDAALRGCGGLYRVASGIPFLSPASGANVACVSVWERLPDRLQFPLCGSGDELAVFLMGVTNPMQSRVENGWLEVRYRDGGIERVSLVNPLNFDDWLNAPCQQECESVPFSDTNHGIVLRIALDPARELQTLTAGATANEVILGVLGISIRHVGVASTGSTASG